MSKFKTKSYKLPIITSLLKSSSYNGHISPEFKFDENIKYTLEKNILSFFISMRNLIEIYDYFIDKDENKKCYKLATEIYKFFNYSLDLEQLCISTRDNYKKNVHYLHDSRRIKITDTAIFSGRTRGSNNFGSKTVLNSTNTINSGLLLFNNSYHYDSEDNDNKTRKKEDIDLSIEIIVDIMLHSCLKIVNEKGIYIKSLKHNEITNDGKTIIQYSEWVLQPLLNLFHNILNNINKNIEKNRKRLCNIVEIFKDEEIIKRISEESNPTSSSKHVVDLSTFIEDITTIYNCLSLCNTEE